MTFEECVQSIHEGSVITFKEYTLDRHETRRLSLLIENCIVHSVINANSTLSRELLEQYYGTELEDVDYLQLASMNCPRLVLNLGLNKDNHMDIKIVVLNKDFYNTKLQEIFVTNEVDIGNLVEPNYLLAQGGW